MARTASIILTPAERKAQVTQLKNDIRETVAQIKTIVADEKAIDEGGKAAARKFERAIKADIKQRDADSLILIKQRTVCEKRKALLEAQLSALVNDPAFMPVKKVKDAVVTSKGEQVVVVVSDVPADKPKRTRRTKAEMEAFRAGAAA